MNKLFLVLALLFALSACSVGKKCTYTQDGTKLSSYVWFYSGDKPIDLDKNNCSQEFMKYLFTFLILTLLVCSTAYAGSTQSNVSGSNTAIEGGYESSTTYESGSESSATTSNTTTSNIRS